MEVIAKSQIREILSSFRGAFVSAIIFSIFINLLMLTVPLYLINVFSHVFSSRSLETLTLLTIVAGGALLLQSSLEWIRGRMLVRVSVGIERKLGKEVLGATLLGAAGTSSHSAQPLRDVSELRGLLGGGEIFKLVDIPLIPVFVGVIYLFHPVLAMIALAGAIALFAIAVINEVLSRGPMKTYNELAMESQKRADDFVRNADVIRAMGMMPAVNRIWAIGNEKKYQPLVKGADWSSRLSILARFVRMMLQMSMLGGGTYLYLQQEILPGTVIASSILMGRALAPVEGAIGTWKNVVSGQAAYRRLATLLRLAQKEVDQTPLPAPEGHVSVERVVVAVPDSGRLLLKQVTFNLEKGEMLGMIGPSGAGKTTLGKALVGVMKINSGTLRIDGADLRQWNPDELGQYLGYLPQDVQLFAGTVAENIARLNLSAKPQDIVEAAKFVGVHDLILRLPKGYDTPIGEGGVALSAGQRQHIGLARAYFGRPALVVLDEPNANLDANGEMALQKALLEGKKLGITQVVISHRPGVLQPADKLLLLRDGAVEAFGPTKEVMALLSQGKEPRQRLEGNAKGNVTSMPRYSQWSGKRQSGGE